MLEIPWNGVKMLLEIPWEGSKKMRFLNRGGADINWNSPMHNDIGKNLIYLKAVKLLHKQVQFHLFSIVIFYKKIPDKISCRRHFKKILINISNLRKCIEATMDHIALQICKEDDILFNKKISFNIGLK